MHLNSQLLFRRHALGYFRPGLRVLEIGPDGFPSTYRQLLAEVDLAWDTLDMRPEPRLTFSQSDPYRFPIADDTYDIVLSGQVAEHVRKVWVWMRELARITKPGGHILTINPVNWAFHAAPVDCWRIYPQGHQALCEDAGLELVSAHTESLEPLTHRLNLAGLRRLVKRFVLPRTPAFEPYLAIDTIAIARKPQPSSTRAAA